MTENIFSIFFFCSKKPDFWEICMFLRESFLPPERKQYFKKCPTDPTWKVCPPKKQGSFFVAFWVFMLLLLPQYNTPHCDHRPLHTYTQCSWAAHVWHKVISIHAWSHHCWATPLFMINDADFYVTCQGLFPWYTGPPNMTILTTECYTPTVVIASGSTRIFFCGGHRRGKMQFWGGKNF